MQGIRIFMLCMMMRLTALMTYCWMACVLASCVGSASSDAIEVNLLHTDVDTIAYSAFVDSIEYIPLETTEECLVGEVTDVVMAGDRLFVFDAKQQEVWSFDRSGRYVGRLGRRGEGPGEYLSIAQFEYDHRDSLLAVLTFVGAPCVQYYSPDGTYVKTVKLGMPADDFKLGADGSFILSCAGRDDPSAGIYHADASGGAVRPLVTRKQGQLLYTTFPWELCSYGDVVSFMSPVFECRLPLAGRFLAVGLSFPDAPRLVPGIRGDRLPAGYAGLHPFQLRGRGALDLRYVLVGGQGPRPARILILQGGWAALGGPWFEE